MLTMAPEGGPPTGTASPTCRGGNWGTEKPLSPTTARGRAGWLPGVLGAGRGAGLPGTAQSLRDPRFLPSQSPSVKWNRNCLSGVNSKHTGEVAWSQSPCRFGTERGPRKAGPQPACSGHLCPSSSPAGPAPLAVQPGGGPSTQVSPRGRVTGSQLHFLVRPGAPIPPTLSKLWPGRWQRGSKRSCHDRNSHTQRRGAGLAPRNPPATAACCVTCEDAGASGRETQQRCGAPRSGDGGAQPCPDVLVTDAALTLTPHLTGAGTEPVPLPRSACSSSQVGPGPRGVGVGSQKGDCLASAGRGSVDADASRTGKGCPGPSSHPWIGLW